MQWLWVVNIYLSILWNFVNIWDVSSKITQFVILFQIFQNKQKKSNARIEMYKFSAL